MASSMQLHPHSEVTLSLPAIVFKSDSIVTIGRGAEGTGRLPQDWLQVSSKHCAVRYDADKVCTAAASRNLRVLPTCAPPGLQSVAESC